MLQRQPTEEVVKDKRDISGPSIVNALNVETISGEFPEKINLCCWETPGPLPLYLMLSLKTV